MANTDALPAHARLLREAKRRQASSLRRMWVLRIAAAILALGVWEILTMVGVLNPINVSHPIGIFSYLIEIIASGDIWRHVLATTSAALGGLAVGAGLGVLAGMLLDTVPVLSRALDPYIIMLNAMPRPALAPIVLLWFGLGATPKVIIASSIVFFVLLLTTRAGLQTVDRDIQMLMHVYGMTKVQQFTKVRLMNAMPSIIAGLRLGAVYAVLGVVVTEMVASQEGLGQLVVYETGRFNTDGAFAVIFLLAVIATLFDLGVSVIQKRFEWGKAE